MKNKIIKITSVTKGMALLTIRRGGKRITARRFANIDKAMEFAVSSGNRQTELYLNSYEHTPYAWVQ